jgi:signal transduction histidine kinase
MLTGSMIIVGVSLLTIYLLFVQRQLKRAEAARSQLSGMLINAQEQERSRIASELHDDFSQRLATLTLGLETAAQIIPESPQEAILQLQKLSTAASALGEDIHTLTHRLHSATLETLGITSGVKAFCKEFATQQAITVDTELDDIPRSVSSDVSLCIFRIVQESLRNVKKHSGASSAHVSLHLVDNTIQLSVSDPGLSFNHKEIIMKADPRFPPSISP